jgi:hypothetical protein
MHTNLKIEDEMKFSDPEAPAVELRKPYKVIAESGLFKNGKQYGKGETIDLTEKTAANFLNNKDIEAI